jgi:hypothetical protein
VPQAPFNVDLQRLEATALSLWLRNMAVRAVYQHLIWRKNDISISLCPSFMFLLIAEIRPFSRYNESYLTSRYIPEHAARVQGTSHIIITLHQ